MADDIVLETSAIVVREGGVRWQTKSAFFMLNVNDPQIVSTQSALGQYQRPGWVGR